MPRKPLIRSNILPYHVTARGNNREVFPCDLEDAWKVFSKELTVINEVFGAKIHAFVMMPNHFHLLITTPTDDLGVVMHKLISSVTRTLNLNSGRSGRIFGGRYHWSLVSTDLYYDCVLKYIYRNPVRANLVSAVEKYEFSSLKGVLTFGPLLFPIDCVTWSDEIIPGRNKAEFLKWLNDPFKKEDEAAIRKGFRKLNFSPPNTSWKLIIPNR